MSNYHIYLKRGKCSFCENNLVIQRKHSGDYLCPDCFVKSVERIIRKTISKYKMFKKEDKIVVGLSGGKDSIALLYNLNQIQKKVHNAEALVALTIDEGIEDYRQNSIQIAKEFCKANDIEQKIISFKDKVGKSLDKITVLKKESEGYRYTCNYCAAIRRRLLNEGAKELGADVLAMGHNLTDVSETFLMNILYKRFHLIAGQYLYKQDSKELSRFFVKKVMPLMRIPEEEIFLYANIKKLNYYPSHCPYRERDPIVRKRVLEFIQEFKKSSPEVEFNLLNGFLELSEMLYNHFDAIKFNYCETCGYPCGKAKICSYCAVIKDLN